MLALGRQRQWITEFDETTLPGNHTPHLCAQNRARTASSHLTAKTRSLEITRL